MLVTNRLSTPFPSFDYLIPFRANVRLHGHQICEMELIKEIRDFRLIFLVPRLWKPLRVNGYIYSSYSQRSTCRHEPPLNLQALQYLSFTCFSNMICCRNLSFLSPFQWKLVTIYHRRLNIELILLPRSLCILTRFEMNTKGNIFCCRY